MESWGKERESQGAHDVYLFFVLVASFYNLCNKALYKTTGLTASKTIHFVFLLKSGGGDSWINPVSRQFSNMALLVRCFLV